MSELDRRIQELRDAERQANRERRRQARLADRRRREEIDALVGLHKQRFDEFVDLALEYKIPLLRVRDRRSLRVTQPSGMWSDGTKIRYTSYIGSGWLLRVEDRYAYGEPEPTLVVMADNGEVLATTSSLQHKRRSIIADWPPRCTDEPVVSLGRISEESLAHLSLDMLRRYGRVP